MKQTIIADSGATKTAWASIVDGKVVRFQCVGMNPATTAADEIRRNIRDVNNNFDFGCTARSVRFYGAGCIGQNAVMIKEILCDELHTDDVEVMTDMEGAAKALCGDRPGIACIIGTGSNSCLYDGSRIVDNVPPLGWIVGDEGSGAYIGKKLVNAVYKRRLPADLCDSFEKWTGFDRNAAINRIYREPNANRWLASLTRFVKEYIDRYDLLDRLVTDSFNAFLEINVAPYGKKSELPLYFSGSVALHFRTQLERAVRESGYLMGRIITDPLDELVRIQLERQQ